VERRRAVDLLDLDDRSEQAPADRKPYRDRDQEGRGRQDDPHQDEEPDGAEQRPESAESHRVRGHGADLPPGVDLEQGARRRGLDEAETEQRERRADDHGEQRRAARALTRAAQADKPEPFEHEPLEERDDDGDRDQEQPDPQEDPGVADVHRA
jgi:hypothetical protein